MPDRNAQFERINERAKTFLQETLPVISVDTRKKNSWATIKMGEENIGRKAISIEVNMHDCPDEKEGKVAPYGVYDLGKNKGCVGIGITSDTAEFAVIRFVIGGTKWERKTTKNGLITGNTKRAKRLVTRILRV